MSRGFTLIEVLLALLIVTTGIVTLSGLLSSSLDSDARSRNDLQAVAFADLVLNHLHAAESWEAIPTTGVWSVPNYNGDPTLVTLGTKSLFTAVANGRDGASRERFSSLYLLDINPEGRIKTVTLRIWPERRTRGKPRVYTTSIYDWSHESAATD